MWRLLRLALLGVILYGVFAPQEVCALGFTVSGATVTLANLAQLGTISDLLINTGSLVANTSQIIVSGNWTNTGGSFTSGTSTVTFNGASAGKTITSKGYAFNNLYLNGVGGGYWTLQDSMTITSSATLTAGTLDTNAASSFGLSVAGNWNSNGGVFVGNSSTVTFTGAATSTSTLNGSTTFYSLSCTVAGKGLMMQANSTQTVTGTLTLTGSNGNLIRVNSTASPTQAYLNNSGFNSVSFVSAKDNNASAGDTISAGITSVDGTNNTNWLFAAPVLSVTFSTHVYNFGTVNLAATTVSTNAVVVTNAGNTTETFSLSVSTIGAQTLWGVATSTPTGFDNFALFNIFNSVQPSTNTFVLADVVISTPTTATSTIYAGDQNARHVPIAATRNLWMCLYTASTTDTNQQQKMNLVVTASAP